MPVEPLGWLASPCGQQVERTDSPATVDSGNGGVKVSRPRPLDAHELPEQSDAASIVFRSDGGVEVPEPKKLFPTQILGGGASIDIGRQYDVARDGRFLINTVVESSLSPIVVMQNWAPASAP
jgi:hypothetical protein